MCAFSTAARAPFRPSCTRHFTIDVRVSGSHAFVADGSILPRETGEGPPAFYGAFLDAVAAAGFDFVKIDDQATNLAWYRGGDNAVRSGRACCLALQDAVAARFAVEVSGIDAIALTKLDILDGFDEIKVATSYRLPDGSTTDTFPADAEIAEALEPVYETVPAWRRPTEGVTTEAELPPEALDYLGYLEEKVGVPIAIVSNGPRREETMIRGNTELSDRLRKMIG